MKLFNLFMMLCVFGLAAGCGGNGSESADAGTDVLPAETDSSEGQNLEEAPSTPLRVDRLSPNSGAETGWTLVIIEGQGFLGERLQVFFGDNPIRTINIYSDSLMLVATPEGPAGESVDVKFDNGMEEKTLEKAFTYIEAHEIEPQDAKGENDTVEKAQEIPLNSDFTGFIGQENDIDYLAFTVPENGVVSIGMDFVDSFAGRGIYLVLLVLYIDAEIPYQVVGVDVKDATTDGQAILSGFDRSVTASQGTYLLKVISVPGDLAMMGVQGWDPFNPYVLRVDFYPGPGLEADQPEVNHQPVGAVDTWKDSWAVQFDQATPSRAEISSFAWYDNDFDWYEFTTLHNGWLRIRFDIEGFDPNPRDLGTLIYLDMVAHDPDWQDIVTNLGVGDPANMSSNVAEIQNLPAGKTYYLRLWSLWGQSRDFPYHIVLEHGPGGIEDSEPGDEPKSDSEFQSLDMGVLSAAQVVSHQSYMWHDGDVDWYKLRTPVGSDGKLCLTWDYQDSYDSLGWWDSSENPRGISYVQYLYDQAWYENPDHSFSGFLIYAGESDTPEQRIEFNVQADTDHYIGLWAMRGFDPDHLYSWSALFVEGNQACPSP